MIIEATNLYLSYEENQLVIKNGNFHVKERDFVFVGGKSGSGKSTLLKSLYGAIPVKNGSLFVDNVNMSNISSKVLMNLRKDIGVVFQDYKLINEMTIEENIMLPLKINGYDHRQSLEQAYKLLKHINLSHRVGYYPKQLSGGEQQRIALARALAHNPKIILADEPIGNLDEFSAQLIWKLLQGANETLGITVVVVTHNVPQDFEINFRQFSLAEGGIYEVF